MRKFLLIFSMFAVSAFAQVTWTPPVKPVAAAPGKLAITTATVNCTLTGNAVPATALTISCSVAGVAITPYTVPFNATGGTLNAYTFQHNWGSDAVTVIMKQNATAGVDFQATANTATATTGTF